MWINLIISQILLYQTCQGISQSENASIQTISTEKSGCQPLEENLKKYGCTRLNGEVDLSNSIWELPKNLQHLTITDSEKLVINLATLTSFTKLTVLIIQDSQVSEFKLNGNVPDQIKVLKFVRCWSRCPEVVSIMSVNCEPQLLDLNTTVLYSLRGLKELYIINCNLSSLTEPKLPIILNITGGRINCLLPEHEKLPQEESLVDFLWMRDWIKYKNATLTDDVMCFLNKMYWNPLYSLNNLSIKNNIDINQEIMEHCPSKCKCNLVALTFTEGGNFKETGNWMPKLEVTCNNISLAKLPSIIPKHTSSFQARHNNITDIDQIFENDLYLNIHKFLLDHNQIRNIDDEKFYNYLRKRNLDFAIDLSHNQITELPVSNLSTLYKFERTVPIMKITNNPLNCRKCDFLVDFQYILARYPSSFADRLEIRCSESSGHLQPVLSLDVNTICPPDEPFVDQIYVIKGALATILLIVLSYFAYNLYQYKTYSKLPWIVTKCQTFLSKIRNKNHSGETAQKLMVSLQETNLKNIDIKRKIKLTRAANIISISELKVN